MITFYSTCDGVVFNWYIPIQCIDSAYHSASSRHHIFHEMHLFWLKVEHYPVIHDPQALENVVLPNSLSVGSTGK